MDNGTMNIVDRICKIQEALGCNNNIRIQSDILDFPNSVKGFGIRPIDSNKSNRKRAIDSMVKMVQETDPLAFVQVDYPEMRSAVVMAR